MIHLQEVENDLYRQLKASITEFSQTEYNCDVYAIALDCSDEGQIVLRFSTEKYFRETLAEYEKEWGKEPAPNGLHGFKYCPGNFYIFKYEYEGLVNHYLDSYYYYFTGSYYGEGEPIQYIEANGKIYDEKALKKTIHNCFENHIFLSDIAVNCANRLKADTNELNKTDDFIIFVCMHYTYEEFDEYLKKTVDEELFQKLLSAE